jgi:hypothetical protein
MRNPLLARSIVVIAAVLASAVCVLGQNAQQTGPAGAIASPAKNPTCGSVAFLTFELGKLAAVDWVDRSMNQSTYTCDRDAIPNRRCHNRFTPK